MILALAWCFLPGAPVRAGSLAMFKTTLGEMAVELYDEDKPLTVRNFIRLTEFGFYNNTFIHRCEPGVVAQGGGYFAPSTSSTNLFGTFGFSPNFGTITNEFLVGARYSNTYGTIAMAKRVNEPDSASGQWFFNLANNSTNLDNQNGGFTVFGRVLRGSNVLESLNARSYTNGIVNMAMYNTNDIYSLLLYYALPVTFTGDRHPQYNELIYPRIQILKLIMLLESNQARRIYWNSPSSMVCRVEYRESDDGAWSVLHETNGNGLVQSALDEAESPGRRYRIRVE